MGYTRRKHDGEFDFEKLPEGSYFFSGEEGFVKVDVDKHGQESWHLENWFSSLDPDINEIQRKKIIQDIKTRLNADTGMIDSTQKNGKRNFLNPFKNK
tara:strand:- start:2127 stop:2420 length:294 start_codon:yes stop_codon:yes gene_type:complete